MKYDNTSPYFKKWTTKKLKEEAISYYQLVEIAECYGVRDMIAYTGILNELDRRGIEPQMIMTF